MRRLLPLLLLALAGTVLAGLAPTAQAQWTGPQYNIVLSITPPQDALTVDAPVAVVAGKIDFTGDPSTLLNTNGVPVEYTITKAPAWLAVVVSPSHDVIPLYMAGGAIVTGSRTFTVSLHAANATLDQSVLDVVEITATVYPSSPGTPPKSVAQGFPVQYYVPPHEDDCDEHATAAALLAQAREAEQASADEAQGEELVVQSGTVTPVGTWYAVGGFGLVGAGVGLLLRRRLR